MGLFKGRARATPYRSETTFGQLFDSTHKLVFRYVYGLVGGPRQDVEDITADTFLKAWHARNQFEGDHEAAVSWLLTIARNQVIDRYRVQQRRAVLIWLEDVELATSDASPEEQTIENEQWEQLRAIAQTLTDRQREILVLRYLLGWKVKQIAAQMGMTENTVSVNLRRIVQRLQTEVQHRESTWNHEQ